MIEHLVISQRVFTGRWVRANHQSEFVNGTHANTCHSRIKNAIQARTTGAATAISRLYQTIGSGHPALSPLHAFLIDQRTCLVANRSWRPSASLYFRPLFRDQMLGSATWLDYPCAAGTRRRKGVSDAGEAAVML